jgi:hypothetical protein
VLSVRRADVQRLDFAAAEHAAVVVGCVLHAEGVRERARLLHARAGDSGDLDEPEPPHRFDVHATHEPGANDGGF